MLFKKEKGCFVMLDFIKNLSQEQFISIIIAIMIIAILDIFSPMISYLIIKIFNIKQSSKEIKNNTFYMPLKVFFRITGLYLAFLYLRMTFGISDKIAGIITKGYKIIVIITMANSLANSITKKSRLVKRIKDKSEKDLDDSSIRIMVRVIRVLIYIVAVFIIFFEIGYDLSGLATGLGLGSVVLTLALQDTIKNMVGGMIIIMDKPFKVGDYIKLLDYAGSVEDMTFFSTKIRTVDNSVVQIPNSLISATSLENFAKIQKRRYYLDLELVLDTKIEEIEKLKNEIIKLLHKNENVIQDSVNVHFNKIGSNGFNLMVACFFNVSKYMEYLDLQEDVNKQIMNIVNKNNISLAYDTKTIEIKK